MVMMIVDNVKNVTFTLLGQIRTENKVINQIKLIHQAPRMTLMHLPHKHYSSPSSLNRIYN